MGWVLWPRHSKCRTNSSPHPQQKCITQKLFEERRSLSGQTASSLWLALRSSSDSHGVPCWALHLGRSNVHNTSLPVASQMTYLSISAAQYPLFPAHLLPSSRSFFLRLHFPTGTCLLGMLPWGFSFMASILITSSSPASVSCLPFLAFCGILNRGPRPSHLSLPPDLKP